MQKSEQELLTIRECLKSGNLPGKSAMLEMAPSTRRKYLMIKQEKAPTLAGVMLLLYPKNNELHFPLIIRTNNYISDKHRGQIAMPGGKKEDVDENLWDCALRETHEELGIKIDKVEKLGELTSNFIPISNFYVHPFVAFLPFAPAFKRQVDEVAAIIEVKLSAILDPTNVRIGEITLATGDILNDIPYFKLGPHKVWGATAMMLNEFITLIGPKIIT